MNKLSLLNNILGPVIRGPSSSHTAGAFFLGQLARFLLGNPPVKAKIIFNSGGSYARVFRQQKSDLGFAAGLLGWEITDDRFPEALKYASQVGLNIIFGEASVPGADHPNFVALELENGKGKKVHLKGKSVGGGMVEIVEINTWPISIRGDRYDYLILIDSGKKELFLAFLKELFQESIKITIQENQSQTLFHLSSSSPISDQLIERLKNKISFKDFWSSQPLMPVVSGEPLFRSAAEAMSIVEREKMTLGELAIAYESRILGFSENEVKEELSRRLQIMTKAVSSGLNENLNLQLLKPTAGLIYKAEKENRLAAGGMLTRAASRAMAAQHTAASMGVVCAAPTAGSAGTLPGVMVTLLEDKGIDEEKAIKALAAAGAIGLIVGYRATFAAEVAGCQVEIGAAGAMGAAAVVEASGGKAKEAFDAAAISFQNTMGSVCDLVQGICEIPCHTRNAVAAASAFICADLILGGYENPIPFDETIDAVYEVGKMLPLELKVTSLGGLALCPSAQSLKKRL